MSKTKIKIWLVSESVLWKSQVYVVDYVENFFAKEAVTVEWRFIPWVNLWGELVSAFKSKNPPDIFEIGSSWIRTFAELNFLSPINYDFRRDIIADWINEISIVRNEKVAIPWYLDLSLLIGRRDILNQYGINIDNFTFDTFLSTCEIIGKNFLPLGFSFVSIPSLLHNFISFFWANGWDFPDFSKGKVNIFTDKRFIDTLLYISKLWHVSKMPKTIALTDYFLIQEAFFRENGFAFFITHWLPNFINIFELDKDEKFKIFEFPYGKAGNFQWSGGSYLAISSMSKKKEICYEVIKYFISDDFLTQKLKREGKFSPYLSIYEKKENEKIKTLIQNSKSYPSNPLWFSIEKMLYKGLSEILWCLLDFPEINEEVLKIASKWDRKLNKLIDIKWGIL